MDEATGEKAATCLQCSVRVGMMWSHFIQPLFNQLMSHTHVYTQCYTYIPSLKNMWLINKWLYKISGYIKSVVEQGCLQAVVGYLIRQAFNLSSNNFYTYTLHDVP